MIRHGSLISLSRDHHDGLLLATRLQQGKRALLRLWSHDTVWQAEYVVRFYNNSLEAHFEAEEKVLFPLARKHIHEDKGIIDRLVTEHEKMRLMVDAFRRPGTKDSELALKEFGRMLEVHIRCEERELFPMCERNVPPSELEDVRESIERYRPKGDTP